MIDLFASKLLAVAVPTPKPTGTQVQTSCDLYKALQPAVAKITGELQGATGLGVYVVVFLVSVLLFAVASKKAGGILKAIGIIVAILLVIGSVAGFVGALAPSRC